MELRQSVGTVHLDRTGLVGVVPEFLDWVGWVVFHSAKWAGFVIFPAVMDWSRIDSLCKRVWNIFGVKNNTVEKSTILGVAR